MKTNQITKLLKELQINAEGKVVDGVYELVLDNSNTYAKMYTLLDNNAVNKEFPATEANTADTPTNFTNYFEKEFEDTTYEIALIADFAAERYVVHISEANEA